MLVVGVLSYFLLQTRPVYLLDFSVFRCPDRCVQMLAGVGVRHA